MPIFRKRDGAICATAYATKISVSVSLVDTMLSAGGTHVTVVVWKRDRGRERDERR